MHGSEEFEESGDNLEAALEYWDEDEKEELVKLHEMLKKSKKISKELQKKVAKFCLRIIDETSQHKNDIQETSYVLASFIHYSFDEELSDAFSIAGELELPQHYIGGKVFPKWKQMKILFEKASK